MNPLDPNPDEEDHTVMADRQVPDEEDHTVMVDRQVPDEEDHTVMVDRQVPDEDDHTVMVDRQVPDEDDHTVMVDRQVLDEDDHTIMVSREVPDEDDHTVVVNKTPKTADASPSGSPQLDKPQAGGAARAARRRGLTPPPVPAGFAPQAVEAAGPHATEIYRPRAIPAAPPEAPVILQGPDATREASATMPSVARHARVTARVALVVFVTSCVASIVGLTLIALTLF